MEEAIEIASRSRGRPVSNVEFFFAGFGFVLEDYIDNGSSLKADESVSSD